jgi:hypothetical protein
MKGASIAELKKELVRLEHGELLDACLRLARFKKDNKELLTAFWLNPAFHTVFRSGFLPINPHCQRREIESSLPPSAPPRRHARPSINRRKLEAFTRLRQQRVFRNHSIPVRRDCFRIGRLVYLFPVWRNRMGIDCLRDRGVRDVPVIVAMAETGERGVNVGSDPQRSGIFRQVALAFQSHNKNLACTEASRVDALHDDFFSPQRLTSESLKCATGSVSALCAAI